MIVLTRQNATWEAIQRSRDVANSSGTWRGFLHLPEAVPARHPHRRSSSESSPCQGQCKPPSRETLRKLHAGNNFTQGNAAQVISLVLAFSIAGRLIMGWLADRFPKKYVMVLIYLLVAGAIPILFAGRSEVVVYTFAVILEWGSAGLHDCSLCCCGDFWN